MKTNARNSLSRRALLALVGAGPVLGQVPYKARPVAPLRYNSPHADVPIFSPEGEVRIGFFGPDDPGHPQGGTLWMGAALAVEHANLAGGYHGAPYRLLSRWSEDPWRAGASAIVKLAYQENICALVGGVNSETTHLATQIAAKALLPVIDPISTDETSNNSGVPWIFSWAPANRAIARCLQGMLSADQFLLVAGNDHDSRMLAAEFLKQGPRRPDLRIDTSGHVHPELPRRADQALVVAPPACTVACVESFPASTRILAGPAASSRLCSPLAGRMKTPALVGQDASLWKQMEVHFQQPADAFAQLSYEATSTLIEVIREVGPSRSAIREALASRMPPGGRRHFMLPAPNHKEFNR